MSLTAAPAAPAGPFPPAELIPLPIDEQREQALLYLIGQAQLAAPLDRLEATPLVVKRKGQPFRPVVSVIIDGHGAPFVLSADLGRRAATLLSALGQGGAALDLMRECDEAEEAARFCQRGVN